MTRILAICLFAILVIAANSEIAWAASPSPISLSEGADIRYDEPTGRSCVLLDVATHTQAPHIECKPPKSWAERRAGIATR
jgi:hypothetical protein